MYEIIYEDVEPNEEYEKTIEQVLKECYKVPFLIVIYSRTVKTVLYVLMSRNQNGISRAYPAWCIKRPYFMRSMVFH